MKRIITYSQYSHTGSRPVNEDAAACYVRDGTWLFVLCDGLGGHGMGDAASQLAVSAFGEAWQHYENGNPRTFWEESFRLAQKKLLEAQKEKRASGRMKTTAAALLTDGKKAWVAHMGDSRCYAFSKGKVLRRTSDHSVPQMLALSGQIREAEIRNHPDRSLLLKALGVAGEEVVPELSKPFSLRKCDAFLLCSDGFWELITEADMEQYLAEAKSAEDWLTRMAAHVRTAGRDRDMDNNSAIALWCRKE